MKPRPRKRHRTLLMVLLLLTYSGGGAIINVAVAWGCAAWSGRNGLSKFDDLQWDETLLGLWNRAYPFGLKIEPSTVDNVVVGAFGIDVVHLTGQTVGRHFEANARLNSFQCGWPIRAMGADQWRLVHEEDAKRPITTTAELLSISCPELLSFKKDTLGFACDGRLLPLRILWPGFAINTIFYAAILWLLFAAPGFVRRRIRIKRGQCPACAYPIGSNDVCTECGATVKRQQATA